MTTKVNPLVLKPRIIIEVDPATAQSNLKVKGPLNMIGVALALSAQLNSILPQLFAEIFKNASMVDSKGNPMVGSLSSEKPNGSMTIEYEPEDEPPTGQVS